MTVAALFVQPRGIYTGRPGVDPWDKSRDARLYDGPYPVVAHPPCSLWSRFAALNYSRYGGEHNRPGNDGGCFRSALAAVRRWGGVLEHPAFSDAWPAHDLPRPVGIGWHLFETLWVCEVWQNAYGHKARKRTWLLYSGRLPPFELRWERNRAEYWVGADGSQFHKPRKRVTKREASATPPEFATTLLMLAQWSRL